ncbi:metal ABC transporter substrate-binding protein [Corynebacterium liangguodongii]|uniref:Zinc ABC transporter substrate-binding protein n=1 Tax=Corynebacterium liangguodongii TaxID=2079535 RepID=A0A2S0WC29_9CORY|nr:metal ABC transporter substrate-binding protein [Corynebacterium liangguodongii]AWB83316.1 zinc ABC transporter substrate-binding protein [Corynebacterium liangguodongii]PWC00594.1 zinc ABC transporter substrate-binding protein [Corynebacterium liangguodongii]
MSRLVPLLLALVLGLAGCAPATDDAQHGALKIFATTGYLADAARNIAPDAEITTMVGPGGDPHTYQPTTKDLETMRDSDLVVWNGLHLEAHMIDQLESLGDKQLEVGTKVDSGELLPWPDQPGAGEKLYDPHIWNSPALWSQVVDAIGAKLGEIDPERAPEYAAAAESYKGEIAASAQRAQEALATVHPRILITGHDAFNYFGKTFGFEVFATDFVTTEAAKSPAQISALADTIAHEKVPVIFHDNQANPQAIDALKEAVRSRGWEVEVSDAELFADTLGPTPPTDTYLGAFEHNANVVAEALA